MATKPSFGPNLTQAGCPSSVSPTWLSLALPRDGLGFTLGSQWVVERPAPMVLAEPWRGFPHVAAIRDRGT